LPKTSRFITIVTGFGTDTDGSTDLGVDRVVRPALDLFFEDARFVGFFPAISASLSSVGPNAMKMKSMNGTKRTVAFVALFARFVPRARV
tara:strand:- start:375 stop:644 length:270 start_codon:yes stop_codon:yes gene_type:complete